MLRGFSFDREGVTFLSAVFPSPFQCLRLHRRLRKRSAQRTCLVHLPFADCMRCNCILDVITGLFGVEDISRLRAGGQAEFLAKDISTLYAIGIEWCPLLIEMLHVFILTVSERYIHIILRVAGGEGAIKDTFKMIACSDAPD